ncbi:MAG: hypothetical protein V4655_10925 [Bdellovibrionota bacterium]
MFKTLVLASLVISTQVSAASSQTLQNVLTEASVSYKEASPSNWLAFKVLSSKTLDKLTRTTERNQILDAAELHYAVSDCLLIADSAYSPVIDPDARHSLAKSTTQKLLTWAKENASIRAFSRLSYDKRERFEFTADFEIINSACSLRIDLGDGSSVIADSHSVD